MILTIIADDLTGANDSAAQFARLGLETYTALPDAVLDKNQSPEVMVFDTESRDILPRDAGAAVTRAIEQVRPLKPEIFFKKIDSTLRGNLGAEIKALAGCLNSALTVVAPAFISGGRTTEGGLQLLHGVKLEETELARVPKSPVKSSDIAAIIRSQADFETARLGIAGIEKGPDYLTAYFKDRISEHRGQLIVCDATKEEHLDAVAAALKGLPDVLYVGSAGLALSLSRLFSPKTAAPQRPQVPKVLVLSGSISAVTRAQTNRLLKENKETLLVRVSPRTALVNPDGAALECVREVTKNLGDYKVFIVSAALREEDVEECRAQGQALGLKFSEVGECMARVMEKIMTRLANDFAGFVMTGGDTAVHACAAVGAGVLALHGEVAPGIPVSEIVQGRHAHKFLITKAGAFGAENAFVEAVNYLFGNQH